jgi:hypothetical protein
MLFVYQSTFQKHLIQRYGNGMCLLDSTYKTTKYTVPLFFVCIPTNIGFQVVASFVVGKETTSLICEALKMISEWNPHWKPENFITDFDQREISALEKVFPGIKEFMAIYRICSITLGMTIFMHYLHFE